jgi:hypothetical protein
LSKRYRKEDVMIIFIDRFADGGFKFYPLRKGTLVKINKKEAKVYFTVKLLEYYAVSDISSFNTRLKNVFAPTIPKINPNGDPNIDGLGLFAFKGMDISKEFTVCDNPWTTIVEKLSDLNVFSEGFTIFTQAELCKANANDSTIRCSELVKRKNYRVNLGYYFKEQDLNKNSYAEIELEDKERSYFNLDSSRKIQNKRGRIPFEITVKKDVEQKYEDISFRLVSSSCKENRQVFIANAPIKVAIAGNKLFVLEIAFYVILITICSWLLNIDPAANVKELTTPGIIPGFGGKLLLSISQFLLSIRYEYSIILTFINSILTLLVIWRFGKKIL